MLGLGTPEDVERQHKIENSPLIVTDLFLEVARSYRRNLKRKRLMTFSSTIHPTSRCQNEPPQQLSCGTASMSPSCSSSPRHRRKATMTGYVLPKLRTLPTETTNSKRIKENRQQHNQRVSFDVEEEQEDEHDEDPARSDVATLAASSADGRARRQHQMGEGEDEFSTSSGATSFSSFRGGKELDGSEAAFSDGIESLPDHVDMASATSAQGSTAKRDKENKSTTTRRRSSGEPAAVVATDTAALHPVPVLAPMWRGVSKLGDIMELFTLLVESHSGMQRQDDVDDSNANTPSSSERKRRCNGNCRLSRLLHPLDKSQKRRQSPTTSQPNEDEVKKKHLGNTLVDTHLCAAIVAKAFNIDAVEDAAAMKDVESSASSGANVTRYYATTLSKIAKMGLSDEKHQKEGGAARSSRRAAAAVAADNDDESDEDNTNVSQVQHKRSTILLALAILYDLATPDELATYLTTVCPLVHRCGAARHAAVDTTILTAGDMLSAALAASATCHAKNSTANNNATNDNEDATCIQGASGSNDNDDQPSPQFKTTPNQCPSPNNQTTKQQLLCSAFDHLSGIVSDYLDDHKTKAFSSAFIEPARFFFHCMNDPFHKDYVRVHGVNFYLTVLREMPKPMLLPEERLGRVCGVIPAHAAAAMTAAGGDDVPPAATAVPKTKRNPRGGKSIIVSTPIRMPVSAMNDTFTPGAANIWEGLKEAVWTEVFSQPEHFGKPIESIKRVMMPSNRDRFFSAQHAARDVSVLKVKNVEEFAESLHEVTDDEQRRMETGFSLRQRQRQREHWSAAVDRFDYFFSKGFLVPKMLETLNSELKPAHAGFRMCAQVLFAEFRRQVLSGVVTLPEHIVSTFSPPMATATKPSSDSDNPFRCGGVIEGEFDTFCYDDEYFTQINVERVACFLEWLGFIDTHLEVVEDPSQLLQAASPHGMCSASSSSTAAGATGGGGSGGGGGTCGSSPQEALTRHHSSVFIDDDEDPNNNNSSNGDNNNAPHLEGDHSVLPGAVSSSSSASPPSISSASSMTKLEKMNALLRFSGETTNTNEEEVFCCAAVVTNPADMLGGDEEEELVGITSNNASQGVAADTCGSTSMMMMADVTGDFPKNILFPTRQLEPVTLRSDASTSRRRRQRVLGRDGEEADQPVEAHDDTGTPTTALGLKVFVAYQIYVVIAFVVIHAFARIISPRLASSAKVDAHEANDFGFISLLGCSVAIFCSQIHIFFQTNADESKLRKVFVTICNGIMVLSILFLGFACSALQQATVAAKINNASPFIAECGAYGQPLPLDGPQYLGYTATIQDPTRWVEVGFTKITPTASAASTSSSTPPPPHWLQIFQFNASAPSLLDGTKWNNDARCNANLAKIAHYAAMFEGGGSAAMKEKNLTDLMAQLRPPPVFVGFVVDGPTDSVASLFSIIGFKQRTEAPPLSAANTTDDVLDSNTTNGQSTKSEDDDLFEPLRFAAARDVHYYGIHPELAIRNLSYVYKVKTFYNTSTTSTIDSISSPQHILDHVRIISSPKQNPPEIDRSPLLMSAGLHFGVLWCLTPCMVPYLRRAIVLLRAFIAALRARSNREEENGDNQGDDENEHQLEPIEIVP